MFGLKGIQRKMVPRQIRSFLKHWESTTFVATSQGIGDDALSKVFGPEHWGRVRGLGSGVTPSKIGMVSQNKAHATQLQEEVGTLKEQMTRQNEQIARQNKIFVQQNELIKKLLGAVQVQQGGSIVDLSKYIPDVSALTENTMHPSRHIDVSKVQRVDTEHILEPHATSNSIQSGSPPQAQGNTNMFGRKCKLMNWIGEEELVAIGRWDTAEPNTMVHSVRLGENAFRVWVDDVINGFEPLWKITSFIEKMADAKGTMIACPNKSIVFDDDN